ncbi:Vacuolar protein sorting-associated protein 26A [Sciurus carolinensis]|uniref:Vacuolar protein sorting-associated protein 26A n=1 Tax=Sciurus carolinensis TaxID=30640 RepID=A0AA41N8U2_SCICA|nr:Vacuolar protein sorting-associated protein 26A [Sciurus carolinensis]
MTSTQLKSEKSSAASLDFFGRSASPPKKSCNSRSDIFLYGWVTNYPWTLGSNGCGTQDVFPIDLFRGEKLISSQNPEAVGVNLAFKQPGKRLEHQGIRIEFVGQIELFNDKSNTHEFVNLVKELALPGELTQSRSYDFEFMQVEKPYESYIGANVRLRYFLKVTIVRRLTDLVKEYDLIVHQLATYPDVNNSIKMEVGIEDCLHIEFEYNKSKYHLKDVIVGKIYFLLVRIKIQHMELQLIKKEITGIGPSTTTETETIAKYEIMDGAPVKGESIPIRLFLAGYDPTPTMRDVNKKFSVRYFLNLVLVDEEDRRYFKQQEIILWRKAPEKLRKQRTNFHQRFESPESQASAEQPEM